MRDIDKTKQQLINELETSKTQCKRVEEALRKAHEELEMRVGEQTEELTKASEQLRAEITERKQAERAVQEARKYAEGIVETVREPMMVLDADLRVISANRSFYRTFKVAPAETVGQFIYDLGNRQWDIPRLRELLEDILPKNTTFDDFEVEHEFGTIGRKTMLLNARRIYQKVNKTQMILVAIEDITKRKQAEEKLRQYHEHLEELVEARTAELRRVNEQLEQQITERIKMEERLLISERLATLGRFSASISHELRNPLGVIDSSVYYLKTRLEGADEKVLQHLERIKSAVGSATAIIQSLLNLTRTKEPQLESLDLVAIASDAIVTSKVPATINVIRNFPKQDVLVNADPELLHMAFKNIVDNAVEAMGSTGTLTVAAHKTTDGQVEISFADTGPGIAPENLDKVFQPLFSTKAKGIGFGLSIAKMVVDKHGGAIEAKSELGKGSTLIIRLPPHIAEAKEV